MLDRASILPRPLPLLLGLGALAWASAGPARAHSAKRVKSGAVVHVERQQVGIALDDKAPSLHAEARDARRALERAVAAWTALDELPLSLAVVDAASPRALITIAFRADAWTTRPLAETRTEADPATGAVRRAFIDVNEQHWRLTEDQLAAVLTHEIGHALGLGHSDDPGSVMIAQTMLEDARTRAPNADDRAGVAAIYGARAARVALKDTAPPPDPRLAEGIRDLTACTRAVRDVGFVVGPCDLRRREASARR